jgi:HSP20 family protein
MRSIASYSPFTELRRMADVMERMWDSNLSPLGGNFGANFQVPIDIWEESNTLFVKAALPGVKPEDINVDIDNGMLTMSGEFKDEHETRSEDRRTYHQEFRYGSFSRTVRLPEGIDDENIDAEYRDGFLTIRIPRTAAAEKQPKKIQVRNAGEGGQKVGPEKAA